MDMAHGEGMRNILLIAISVLSLAACGDNAVTKRQALEEYAAVACAHAFQECQDAPGLHESCLGQVMVAACSSGSCDRLLSDGETLEVDTCIDSIAAQVCGTGLGAACEAMNRL